MRAIVTGLIATYPLGGVVWDYAQYALGLERLGFEVHYLEDTGNLLYDPSRQLYDENPSYGLAFLERALGDLSEGLGRRWCLRSLDGCLHGPDAEGLEARVAGADLFLNVSGGTLLREPYRACPRKLLIDTDPGWNHFVNYPAADARAAAGTEQPGVASWRDHDAFFSHAENLGQSDCLLPHLGIAWTPLRPPVLPECWRAEPPGEVWTTVMTWNNFGRPIEHNGRSYGTKEREFTAIETLPSRVTVPLELAIGGQRPPLEQLAAQGWRLRRSEAVSHDHHGYRHYVQQSRGEFSVAKNVYVATRSGWFSCRSVCYLAAGRPVVLQDTGFSRWLPVGEGLLAFDDLAGAEAALAAVEADYGRHSRAARELAESAFAAERVLTGMLRSVGL